MHVIQVKVGVLAIQGAFSEHKTCLIKASKQIGDDTKTSNDRQLKVEVVEVRTASDMDGLNGLIIPGGESTVISRSFDKNGFGDAVKGWIKEQESPVVWGTCAGMIMLSNNIENSKTGGQTLLGGLDIEVCRNFFGRQINSFEASVAMKSQNLSMIGKGSDAEPYHGVFIRAPAVISTKNTDVEVLGTVTHEKSGQQEVIVAVKQNNIMATAFHPELTDDLRWHRYFLELVFKNISSDGLV